MADENLRRLALLLFQKINSGIRWSETDKDFYEDTVKAVIVGMREPTQKQYDALSWKGKMWKDTNSHDVWTTYIDALVENDI